MSYKNVLISVSDKTGIVELALKLSQNGARIVSTGGTATYLKEKGIKVTDISDQTGFPELMDGRVRSLHPHIHIPILARQWIENDQQLLKEKRLEAFDLLVCNLYPFEDASQKLTNDRQTCEFIDIGGATLIRAAAKNFESIVVLCDCRDYPLIIHQTPLSLEDRKHLSAKAFHYVSSYDALIAKTLAHPHTTFPLMGRGGQYQSGLRYGENPHQKAYWYKDRGANWGLQQAQVLQGKPLSYNNILDLNMAITILRMFKEKTTVVSIKHNNPCGIATASEPLEALTRSLSADPVSVFGGIVAINTAITPAMAQKLTSLFLECVIAPDIDEKTRSIFQKKKNLRVLIWPKMCEKQPKTLHAKEILGGYLLQSVDEIQPWSEMWQIFGDNPTDKIREEIAYAWKAVACLKSNAIAITANKQTLGLGMGQTNRIDAVNHAITRWKTHHGQQKTDIVLASDGFFPFTDSIEKASEEGIKWVVQPGGSIKDKKIIQKAKDLRVNLILTGQRHFLH